VDNNKNEVQKMFFDLIIATVLAVVLGIAAVATFA